MKILLKELINPNTAILTDTQKAVLLTVHVAPSEQMAFDNTNNTENMVTSRDILIKLGALALTPNSLSLTPKGEDMIKYHNLVDDMGEITEDGQKILDTSQEVSLSYQNQDVKEEFKFLASLL